MCPPNVAVVTAGLPADVIGRLRMLAKTQARLYYLFVVWSLFTAAIIFLVPVDAIEPIWALRWLPEFIGFLIPGLPENLVDAAVRRPMVVGALLLTYVLIRRASSLIKAARWEYAFQAWQRTPTVGIIKLPPPIPGPSAFVKCIEAVSPLSWFILAVAVVFVLLIVLDWFCPPPRVVSQACTTSDTGETTSACANATYPCRLKAGEKVTVTIRSDRARNYTGVILDAGVPYTARFVEKIEWRDDKCKVAPEGFEFEKNLVGLPGFWWAEWLRPYPEGRWFQVIGRIKDERDVFPVLDKSCPHELYTFTTEDEGELVLLVNDIRYKNNHGIMRIEIQRQQCQALSLHRN